MPSLCCRVEICWGEGVEPSLVTLKHDESVGRGSTLPVCTEIGSESANNVKRMVGAPFTPTLVLPFTPSRM